MIPRTKKERILPIGPELAILVSPRELAESCYQDLLNERRFVGPDLADKSLEKKLGAVNRLIEATERLIQASKESRLRGPKRRRAAQQLLQLHNRKKRLESKILADGWRLENE